MGSPGDGRWSLDLIVRGGEPTTTLTVHGLGESTSAVELVGTLTQDDDPGLSQRVVIAIAEKEIARLGMTEPEGGEVVFVADDEPTDARICWILRGARLGGPL